MKVTKADLTVLFSEANNSFRETPRHIDMDFPEFIALCWVQAIKLRFPELSIEIDELDPRKKKKEL